MSAPAWALGYDLGWLRSIAAIFADHDAPYALGAFSRVKENQVAAWASEGALTVAWAAADRPVAACVASWPRQRRTTVDFSGRRILQTGPGDLAVRRVAHLEGWGAAAVDMIQQLRGPGGARAANPARVVLDLWQESPRDRAIAAALGARWQGTKIKASSELVGVWATGMPPTPWRPLEDVALARLNLAYDPAPLLAELEGLDWQPHYAVYNKRQSWSALALRGFGGTPDFIIKPAEMSKKWKADNPDALGWACEPTPLWDKLPGLAALADSLPGRKERVRLMRLAPGDGELSRHADITDPDAGCADGRLMRIHLPLLTNPGVRFRGWQPDGSSCELHMAAGSAWWLDTRKPHTARNDGPTERIHLVADVEASPELRALVAEPAPADKPPPPFALPPAAPAEFAITRA